VRTLSDALLFRPVGGRKIQDIVNGRAEGVCEGWVVQRVSPVIDGLGGLQRDC
jgi:hypothetical protein